MTEFVDVIVPRGGKGLVGLVQREARVPVLPILRGSCISYIDKSADPQKTMDVVLNAKTRRTGICGAAECLLIHQDVFDTLGRDILQALTHAGVEVRGDAAMSKWMASSQPRMRIGEGISGQHHCRQECCRCGRGNRAYPNL